MKRGWETTLVGDLEDTKTFPALKLPSEQDESILLEQNLELQDLLAHSKRELSRLVDENIMLVRESNRLAQLAEARMGAILVLIEAAARLIERAENPVVAHDAAFEELLREIDAVWRSNRDGNH